MILGTFLAFMLILSFSLLIILIMNLYSFTGDPTLATDIEQNDIKCVLLGRLFSKDFNATNVSSHGYGGSPGVEPQPTNCAFSLPFSLSNFLVGSSDSMREVISNTRCNGQLPKSIFGDTAIAGHVAAIWIEDYSTDNETEISGAMTDYSKMSLLGGEAGFLYIGKIRRGLSDAYEPFTLAAITQKVYINPADVWPLVAGFYRDLGIPVANLT